MNTESKNQPIISKDIQWLAPDSLSFYWPDESHPIAMSIKGEKTILHIYAIRAFPRTMPEEWVQIYEAKRDGAKGELIGIIADLRELNTEYRDIVKVCLNSNYLFPRVTKVNKILDLKNIVSWDIETDRGPIKFDMTNLRAQLKQLPNNQILFTDHNNNRFYLEDYDSLDQNSKIQLKDYL